MMECHFHSQGVQDIVASTFLNRGHLLWRQQLPSCEEAQAARWGRNWGLLSTAASMRHLGNGSCFKPSQAF